MSSKSDNLNNDNIIKRIFTAYRKRQNARMLTYDKLSQSRLMMLKFSKHKIAVISFFFLASLYFVAIFAGFFAPYNKLHQNLNFAYAPPSKVGFSFAKGGFYVKGVKKMIDEIELRYYYVSAPEYDAPLGFFVKGDEYKLWGLINTDIHFLGVDFSKLNKKISATEKDNYVFFLNGADKYGYDIFSRVIAGARISLSVGLLGIIISMFFGVIIGGISGYCPGKVDMVIQRIIEIISSLPQIPMWLALGAAVPKDWSPLKGYFAIIVLLSFLSWTGLARVVRGKILSLREEEYAVGARLLGAGNTRVLFRHLMPGFSSHIIVSLTMAIPGVVLGETSLSFLGLGLRPPVISWGVMLQDCMDIKAVVYYPWLLAPVVMLILAVLAFNFMGDGLRDAADPYSGR